RRHPTILGVLDQHHESHLLSPAWVRVPASGRTTTAPATSYGYVECRSGKSTGPAFWRISSAGAVPLTMRRPRASPFLGGAVRVRGNLTAAPPSPRRSLDCVGTVGMIRFQ